MKYEFFSGSYGEKGEEGIVKFLLDPENGKLEKLDAYCEIKNPSYLGFNKDKTVLYAVQEEVPEGKIHALRVTEKGLEPLSALSTKGADPCHVTLDSSEKLLFTDNYTSGSLTVFRLKEDGDLESLSQLIVHEGRSVHPVRQSSAHIHYTKEQDGFAYTVDLGMDEIFIYHVNNRNACLEDTGRRLRLPKGSGPRHIEFHRTMPGILYVICELGNEIAVFEETGGEYVLKQRISTLPEDFSGESTAAAVKMQGDYLFASNRGHDGIAVYRIQPDGTLELSQITKTGGKTPRDFTLFDDYLVAANQDSDSITVLRMDWERGLLEPTGISATTVRPTCIRKYRNL